MRLSFLLFKAKKDAAFICICIYTYIGNLVQHVNKIITSLDCQNFKSIPFLSQRSDKICGVMRKWASHSISCRKIIFTDSSSTTTILLTLFNSTTPPTSTLLVPKDFKIYVPLVFKTEKLTPCWHAVDFRTFCPHQSCLLK